MGSRIYICGINLGRDFMIKTTNVGPEPPPVESHCSVASDSKHHNSNSAELSCVPQMLTLLAEFDQFVANVAGQTDSHSISLSPRVYCC